MSDKKKHSDKNNTLSRRQFIRRAGTAAAALTAVGTTTRNFTRNVLGANDRIGIGFIGCGGRSNAHLQTVHYLKTQKAANIDIVAACDVYKPRMQKVVEGYKAKGYMAKITSYLPTRTSMSSVSPRRTTSTATRPSMP